MEEQDLIKKLSLLKNLEPDQDFLAHSKRLILATERPKWLFFTPAIVGALAVFLAAAAGIYLVGLRSGPSLKYASLNQEKIRKEVEDTNIDISLKEISYRQAVTETVASALQEISSDKANHLNENILSREINDAALEEGSRGEINQLLNQIIF